MLKKHYTETEGKSEDRCLWVELPRTEYGMALDLQHRILAARIEGSLTEDIVLALEHPAVFTLGRRGGMENLVMPEDFLKKKKHTGFSDRKGWQYYFSRTWSTGSVSDH